MRFSYAAACLFRATTLAAGLAVSGCCPDPLDPTDLLGDAALTVSDRRCVDYTGPSTHGELFTFEEYTFNAAALRRALRRPAFAQHPRFAVLRHPSSPLKHLVWSPWRPTPVDARTRAAAGVVLHFQNLVDHPRSAPLPALAAAPGCYYAGFSAYPVGNVFCLLNPATGRVYVVRKRG